MNGADNTVESFTGMIFKQLYAAGRRDFTNVKLYGTGTKDANFAGCDFSGATFLFGTYARDCFKDACLKGASFKLIKFIDIDFSGQDLSKTTFSCCNLIGANFTDAKLNEAEFINDNLTSKPDNYYSCVLFYANFERAKLKSAIFRGEPLLRGADLTEADLESAQLADVDLRGAILKSTNFAKANVSGIKLRGTILDDITLESLRSAGLINFKGANLDGLDLMGLDLRGLDFEEANFYGANLTNVDFEGANLDKAVMEGTIVTGANFKAVKLNDANLMYLHRQGVRDFSRVNLSYEIFASEWVFSNCIFRGANFAGVMFSGVSQVFTAVKDIAGINVERASLNLSTYIQLYTAGHRDFRGVYLNSDERFPLYSDCDFTDAVFLSAHCTYIPVTQLDAVHRFSVCNVALSYANFKSLYESGVRDFSGADFSGQDFDNEVNFTDCTFKDAGLSYCDLSKVTSISIADIESASWQNVNLKAVKFPSLWNNGATTNYYSFKRKNFFATLRAILLDYVASDTPFVFKEAVRAFLDEAELKIKARELPRSDYTESINQVLQNLLILIHKTAITVFGKQKYDRELIKRIKYTLCQSGETFPSLASFAYHLCQRENYLSTLATLLEDYVEDDEIPHAQKGMIQDFLKEHAEQFKNAQGKSNDDAEVEIGYLNLLTILSIEIAKIAKPDADLTDRLRHLSLHTNSAAANIIEGKFLYAQHRVNSCIHTLGNLLSDYVKSPRAYPHKKAIQVFLEEKRTEFSTNEVAAPDALRDAYINLLKQLNIKIREAHAEENPAELLELALTDEFICRVRFSGRQSGLDEGLLLNVFGVSLFGRVNPEKRTVYAMPIFDSRSATADTGYEMKSLPGSAVKATAGSASATALSPSSTHHAPVPQRESNGGAGASSEFTTAITSFFGSLKSWWPMAAPAPTSAVTSTACSSSGDNQDDITDNKL